MNGKEIKMIENALIDRDEWEAVECIRYLQSRLESLEKDAARLDWMEQVGRVSIERVREGSAKGPLRWDVEYGRYDNIAESKKSMRDAIDAAMKG